MLDQLTDLVDTICKKIENLEDISNIDEELNKKIYWFYQEAISGKLLPVITEKIDEFAIFTKLGFDRNTKTIIAEIEKDNDRPKATAFDFNRVKTPSQKDIINTILKVNRIKKSYNKTIHPSRITHLEITTDYEEFYLYTKLIIPYSNKTTFLIADGFGGGYSNDLKDVISSYYNRYIWYVQETIQEDISYENQIIVPFEEKIENYPDIRYLIANVEKDFATYNSVDMAKRKLQSKENIIKNLYDLIENSFKEIVKNDKFLQESITKEIILDIAKKDFLIDKNFKVFNISNKDNLSKYIGLALFYKKE